MGRDRDFPLLWRHRRRIPVFGRIATLAQLSVRGIPVAGSGLVHLRHGGKLAVLRLNETGVGAPPWSIFAA